MLHVLDYSVHKIIVPNGLNHTMHACTSSVHWTICELVFSTKRICAFITGTQLLGFTITSNKNRDYMV